MKGVWKTLIALLLVSSLGCATKGFVKEQTDPLADRLGKIEARIAGIEPALDALSKKTDALAPGLNEAKQAAADAKAKLETAGAVVEVA